MLQKNLNSYLSFGQTALTFCLPGWGHFLLVLVNTYLDPCPLGKSSFKVPCPAEKMSSSQATGRDFFRALLLLKNSHLWYIHLFWAEICLVRCCRFNLRSHQLDMARAERKKWVEFVPLFFSITPQSKQLCFLSGPGACSWCAKESSWRNRLWTDSKDHVGWSKPSERCSTTRGETTINFSDRIKLFYNCNTNLACHTRLSKREWALLGYANDVNPD